MHHHHHFHDSFHPDHVHSQASHGPIGAGGRAHNKRALTAALFITGGIMLLEFFGGLLTHSLALLSDAGHMLSDAASLALSLLAMTLAARPPSPGMTYGFSRAEVLAALVNGATLLGIAGIIAWEAVARFFQPPEVASGTMIIVATIGLVANLLSAWWLMRKGDVKGNVNLRSAYLHVLGDALGSVGALVAGLLMFWFSWYAVDPLISLVVAALILKSAWWILHHAVRILMEGSPLGVSRDRVESALRGLRDVVDVHDLHIWTITSGFDSLSCHLVVREGADAQTVLREAVQKIREMFRIHHVTIQIETAPCDTRTC